MTTTRHPVRVEFDGTEAIFVLAAIRRNIAWLEELTADPTVVPTVLKWLRSAADKTDKATYGDESLADGEFYAGMPATSYVEVRTTQCHAGSDGDCSWGECPQLADGEPASTGHHCPLDFAPRCTCSQSWDAKHAPGCLLSEDVRGWDDTRASA
jgi:hypothetical protein